MQQNIFEHLSTDYLMFFHPGLPISALTPGQTLSSCVETCNYLLNLHGRDFSQWEQTHYDTIARVMNANWICQRLATEPIRKPILVHQENNQFVVDCGDTRIMALSAMTNPPCLTAITTVKAEHRDQYTSWVQVLSMNQLIELCGFDPANTNVLFSPADAGLDWSISWFEIGDMSTSHHLHDVNARVHMLQHWLDTQPADFEFTPMWVAEPIDWATFQSKT
jgi:hypothetical protein